MNQLCESTLGIYDLKFPMQTSTRSSIHFSSPLKASVPKCFRKPTATKYGSRMQPPRARQKHVNNGNKFRGPCVVLAKNVITPTHPPQPPVDHKRACATCQQRQQVPWAMCCTRQERYHTPLLTIREHVQHVITAVTNSVGPVLYSSRTLSHSPMHPPHPPLSTIREHV